MVFLPNRVSSCIVYAKGIYAVAVTGPVSHQLQDISVDLAMGHVITPGVKLSNKVHWNAQGREWQQCVVNGCRANTRFATEHGTDVTIKEWQKLRRGWMVFKKPGTMNALDNTENFHVYSNTGWNMCSDVKKLSGGMLARWSVWGQVQICIWPSWCHCHSLSLAPVNRDWFYLPGFTFLVPAHSGNPGHSPGGCKMAVVVV